MKKFRIFAVSILSLMMVLACFALPGCFEPEPEPEPEPPVKYTVTFNLNYSGAPAATTAQVESGSKAQKPADPTRSGYTFDGWFDNANGTGTAFDFNTAITANKTLYAKWTQQTFTVTFNLNYTGAPAATTQQVASGGSVQKPTDPSRTGYTFNGWFRAASGGTAVTFPLTITAATTLYAQWTQQGTDPSPTDPSPSVTPTPSGSYGVIVGTTATSNVPDSHTTTTADDTSWNRYTYNAFSKPWQEGLAMTDISSKLTLSGTTTNLVVQTEAATSETYRTADGYAGIGGFRSASGAVLTFTINASAATRAGLYIHVAWRTTQYTMADFASVTVNGAAADVGAVNMPLAGDGDTQYAPTPSMLFLGYINLNAGTNTIAITRSSNTNASFNFFGIRLSAQTGTLS